MVFCNVVSESNLAGPDITWQIATLYPVTRVCSQKTGLIRREPALRRLLGASGPRAARGSARRRRTAGTAKGSMSSRSSNASWRSSDWVSGACRPPPRMAQVSHRRRPTGEPPPSRVRTPAQRGCEIHRCTPPTTRSHRGRFDSRADMPRAGLASHPAPQASRRFGPPPRRGLSMRLRKGTGEGRPHVAAIGGKHE